MAEVACQDRVTGEEVASRCGVEVLENVLSRRRDEEDPLRRVRELVLEGKRSLGRPSKSWRKTIEEGMRMVGAQEEDALDRDR